MAPPDLEDAGSDARGGRAGGDASAPDGSLGKGGTSGSGGSGQGGSGTGGTTGGSGGTTGSGGSGAAGGSGGTAGLTGSGGTAGKSGAAGSGGVAGGSSGGGGTAGKPDASTDATGGTGASGGTTGGTTGGTGATGGTGGTGGTTGGTGGTGGAAGGTGGTTAGSSGSAGSSNPDASDVARPPDADPDRREVDVAPDVAFDCAAVNGTLYQSHCYYARSVAVDWNTANTTTCEAPAHLATITSAGEQAVVAALLPTQDRWIGLRRPLNSPKAESSFYWVTNEALSYRNWDVYSDADREPNYTGECVRMRFTSLWADAACTDALAVVCEHE